MKIFQWCFPDQQWHSPPTWDQALQETNIWFCLFSLHECLRLNWLCICSLIMHVDPLQNKKNIYSLNHFWLSFKFHSCHCLHPKYSASSCPVSPKEPQPVTTLYPVLVTHCIRLIQKAEGTGDLWQLCLKPVVLTTSNWPKLTLPWM